MKFVIVTGLSGAGRTQTVRCLEDFGYFCVDNLPPALIPKFIELCYQTAGKIEKAAIVVDIRGGRFFDDLFQSLKLLTGMGYNYEIIFLDASDDVLIKRYKETRRTHPLAKNGRIIYGIHEERKRLEEVKSQATHVIDTSNLSTRQLREELQRIYVTGENVDCFIKTAAQLTILNFDVKTQSLEDVFMQFYGRGGK
jgi:UPF0042 nucleotide-binding protein